MQLFQCVSGLLKTPKQTKASAQLLCSSLTRAKRGSAGKAVELKTTLVQSTRFFTDIS